MINILLWYVNGFENKEVIMKPRMTACGPVIVDSNKRILLIRKQQLWGFTGGRIPETEIYFSTLVKNLAHK